jgi:hypothetical protein
MRLAQGRITRLTVAVSLLLVVPRPAIAQGPPPPQPSVADDIHVFDPYIGTFRTGLQHDSVTGRSWYFTVTYEWFDTPRSIVRYTVTMVEPDSTRSTVLSTGFYGYDGFGRRLFVFGAFRAGQVGFGSVERFDRQTFARTTWAQSMQPDGTVQYVRDHFEVIDADSWHNWTEVHSGDGAWRTVVDEIFTRVAG